VINHSSISITEERLESDLVAGPCVKKSCIGSVLAKTPWHSTHLQKISVINYIVHTLIFLFRYLIFAGHSGQVVFYNRILNPLKTKKSGARECCVNRDNRCQRSVKDIRRSLLAVPVELLFITSMSMIRRVGLSTHTEKRQNFSYNVFFRRIFWRANCPLLAIFCFVVGRILKCRNTLGCRRI
jgi:hypothetical protein